jgi:guanylate kinase
MSAPPPRGRRTLKDTTVTDYPGWLFTLVGPAGAGKNHLMGDALARVTTLRQLPTATTRAIRPTEQEGREHYYLTRAAFEKLIGEGALLEYQPIHGNLYGMLRQTVEDALRDGRHVIADIDILGALRARDLFPDNVICIFIQPPSIAALIERMRKRETKKTPDERDAEIAKRLVRVPMELARAADCDYHILNDDAKRAADLLMRVIDGVIAGQPLSQLPTDEMLTTCAFRYVVTALPVWNDEQLTRVEGEPLTIPLPLDELYPHHAALNAVSNALNLHLDDSDVIGGTPEGAFIPPLTFSAHEDECEEVITFAYHIRLPARIDPPSGWHWTPIHAPLGILETA